MSWIFAGQSRIPLRNGIPHYAALSVILQGFSRKHFTLRTLAHGYTFVQ